MAKIIFVSNIWYEFLGVASISAYLKAHGHKTELILGNNKKQILKEIKGLEPDLIGFPCMTIQQEWVVNCATYLKENGVEVPIIIGGPHPTFFPEMIEHPSIDIICRGEGEQPMKELADALSSGEKISKIMNLYIKENGKVHRNALRPLIDDLDMFPHPDRDLYRKYKFCKEENYMQITVGRGCPFHCSFCFNEEWNKLHSKCGKIVRMRSVDNVIDEIKEIEKKYGIGVIMFADSTFNLNKTWFLDFFKIYMREINLYFTCNIRADLSDEDITKALADTGKCVSVRFGVESGNPRVRNILLKKNISNKKLIDARRMYKKYNIPVTTYNMFGMPTETLEEAWDTIHFNVEIKPDSISNYIFQLLPGLEITNLAIEQGLMRSEDFKKVGKSPYRMHRSVLKQKDIDAVTNLHHFSIIAVKFPWTIPIIKNLIKLPPNKIFDMVYSASQGIEWFNWSKMGPMRMLKEIIKNYREFS